MKLKFTKQRFKIFLALGMATGLLIAQPVFATGKSIKKNPAGITESGEDKPAKKSKAKAFTSLNNSSVKIYPDVIKREMHVVAKENDGKEIDFFVFDVEGTLLHHYKMKPKEHDKISGLSRGTYMFHVFSGDEETAAGNFDIR